MAGASNDGGEDSPGGVITGESGLAHAGAIVHDKSGNILVTHDELVGIGTGTVSTSTEIQDLDTENGVKEAFKEARAIIFRALSISARSGGRAG